MTPTEKQITDFREWLEQRRNQNAKEMRTDKWMEASEILTEFNKIFKS